MDHSDRVISTILKHDSKQTSYKIALLRAINDVALSYPDLRLQNRDIAVPLRLLAEYWLAYYWPFVDPEHPIYQGARTTKGGKQRNDMAFRPELTYLRCEWAQIFGRTGAADGFVLVHEMRLPRKRAIYPRKLVSAYSRCLSKIATSIRQPVQYAGPGRWAVFTKPQPLHAISNVAAPVPGTEDHDVCLLMNADLWRTFQKVSLWVEALCIHEWSLFTEGVLQADGRSANRGAVYALLTERPDNRRPLTWERNHVDLLIMEGREFHCPWTQKAIKVGRYDLDHLVPVSLYPMNELWNLVPADPYFNSHVKRARLPSPARLAEAKSYLTTTYENYQVSDSLRVALWADAAGRFSGFAGTQHSAAELSESVAGLITVMAAARNVATF